MNGGVSARLDVVGKMRRDAVDAHVGHELPGGVAHVGTQGFLCAP